MASERDLWKESSAVTGLSLTRQTLAYDANTKWELCDKGSLFCLLTQNTKKNSIQKIIFGQGCRILHNTFLVGHLLSLLVKPSITGFNVNSVWRIIIKYSNHKFVEAIWRVHSISQKHMDKRTHYLFGNITEKIAYLMLDISRTLFTFGRSFRGSFLGGRLLNNYNLIRICTFLLDGLVKANAFKNTKKDTWQTVSKCERL